MTEDKLRKKLAADIKIYAELCCRRETPETERIYTMGLRDKSKEILEILGGYENE